MRDLAIALYEFWNSFGVPAYPMNTVLEDKKLPYITYQLRQEETFGSANDFARVYFAGRNTEEMFSLFDKIKVTIGAGKIIKVGDQGNIIIYEPTAQYLEDTENSISLYLSFETDYNL